MRRTQITLNDDQYKFLLKFSKQSGESISAIIRRAVNNLRNEEELPDNKALRLVGAYEADRSDISVRHDEILWGADMKEL